VCIYIHICIEEWGGGGKRPEPVAAELARACAVCCAQRSLALRRSLRAAVDTGETGETRV
jgi:hypothetical protein